MRERASVGDTHADESVNSRWRKMSATMIVGLALVAVIATFVLMVVDKLGLAGKLRKRRMANLRRAKARQH